MPHELMARRPRQPRDVHGGRGMLEQRSMAYLHDVVQVGFIGCCPGIWLIKRLVAGPSSELDKCFPIRGRVIRVPLHALRGVELRCGNELNV